jgi:hypothetical protein
MLQRILLLSLLALLVPASAALAQERRERTIDRSRHLWATVNICDTAESPDTIGIRASMPGSGRANERMFMRFRVQFFSEVDGKWHNFLAKGTDSGYVPVGRATFKARQSGWTFPFELGPGQRYKLRGAVSYQWRRGTKVVRRAAKRTTKGHRTALSEPRGFSAATCEIKG